MATSSASTTHRISPVTGFYLGAEAFRQLTFHSTARHKLLESTLQERLWVTIRCNLAARCIRTLGFYSPEKRHPTLPFPVRMRSSHSTSITRQTSPESSLTQTNTPMAL